MTQECRVHSEDLLPLGPQGLSYDLDHLVPGRTRGHGPDDLLQAGHLPAELHRFHVLWGYGEIEPESLAKVLYNLVSLPGIVREAGIHVGLPDLPDLVALLDHHL